MAPLLQRATQYLIKLLPISSGTLGSLSGSTGLSIPESEDALATTGTIPSLSAIAPVTNRVDVYGVFATQNISHHYWDGRQWNSSGIEDLGGPGNNPPRVVSLGPESELIYYVDPSGSVLQKNWTGKSWLPGPFTFTKVGQANLLDPSLALSATSWGTSKVDLFGTAAGKSGAQKGIYHFSWDGLKRTQRRLLGS